jgi:hypothetical protein
MEIRLSIDEQPTVSPARTGLTHPSRVVGAVLDAGGFHHARKARAHLRCYAAAISIPQEGAC